MKQTKIAAAFIRGGTSNAIVFNQQHLPSDRALWDEIFMAAIGSPDPYGRQLDGMGGGLSSLSKVCVVGKSKRPDADVDYTFAQVLIKEAKVDYTTMCGNMSSAIGPFAVDEGLVTVTGDEALVRIHSTNTGKIVHARFPVEDGVAVVDGELAIPGVAGTGAPVRLEFCAPGGATTGKMLPTGEAVTTLDVPGVGRIACSMVDAANACVFVRAADVGLTGTEMPEALEQNLAVMKKLGAIRLAASVAMGISKNIEEAARKPSVPFIGVVSAPRDAPSLSGDPIQANQADVTGRMLSNGQVHRALPLTCTVSRSSCPSEGVSCSPGTVISGTSLPCQASTEASKNGAQSRLERMALTLRCRRSSRACSICFECVPSAANCRAKRPSERANVMKSRGSPDLRSKDQSFV